MRTLSRTRAHPLLTWTLRLTTLPPSARETGVRCGVLLRDSRGGHSGAHVASGARMWKRLCKRTDKGSGGDKRRYPLALREHRHLFVRLSPPTAPKGSKVMCRVTTAVRPRRSGSGPPRGLPVSRMPLWHRRQHHWPRGFLPRRHRLRRQSSFSRTGQSRCPSARRSTTTQGAKSLGSRSLSYLLLRLLTTPTSTRDGGVWKRRPPMQQRSQLFSSGRRRRLL